MTTETIAETNQNEPEPAGRIALHCLAGVAVAGFAIAGAILAWPLVVMAWHGLGVAYGFMVIHVGNAWCLPGAGLALAAWTWCVTMRSPAARTIERMEARRRRSFAILGATSAVTGVAGLLLILTMCLPMTANSITAVDIAHAPDDAFPGVLDGTLPIQAFTDSNSLLFQRSDKDGALTATHGVSGYISGDESAILIEARRVAPLDCVRLGGARMDNLMAVNGMPVHGSLAAACSHFFDTLTFTFPVPHSTNTP